MRSQADVAGTGAWFQDNNRFLASRLRLGVSRSRHFWVNVFLVSAAALISLLPRKSTVATIARMMSTATRHRKRTILAVSRFVHAASRNKLAQHPCVLRTDSRNR